MMNGLADLVCNKKRRSVMLRDSHFDASILGSVTNDIFFNVTKSQVNFSEESFDNCFMQGPRLRGY